MKARWSNLSESVTMWQSRSQSRPPELSSHAFSSKIHIPSGCQEKTLFVSDRKTLKWMIIHASLNQERSRFLWNADEIWTIPDGAALSLRCVSFTWKHSLTSILVAQGSNTWQMQNKTEMISLPPPCLPGHGLNILLEVKVICLNTWCWIA
jgi:hypothetical protein